MNLRYIVLAGLCTWAVACSKVDQGTIGLGGKCLYTADCAQPFVCFDGVCQLGPSLVCQKGKLRCNGDTVEKCSDTEDRWELEATCARGCQAPGECRPQVCTPGERKCDGSFISQCLPNGAGWQFVQACPTDCANVDGSIECTDKVCDPFATQCGDNKGMIETCNSRGTVWNETACATTEGAAVCEGGRCLPTVCSTTGTGANRVSEQRCRGSVAEECNANATGWNARQVCPAGCTMVEGKAECDEVICTPFETKCAADGLKLQTCNSRGTAYDDAPCEFPSAGGGATTEGRCVTTAGAGACFPKVCSVERGAGGAIGRRDERCAPGGVREQCNSTETAFEPFAICQFGCDTNGTATECLEAPCNAGDVACDGLELKRCSPDRTSFGFVQFCPSGCSGDKVGDTVVGRAKAAACAAPFCPPLSRTCTTDASGNHFVDVCRADGAAFDRLETCAEECVGGVCVTTQQTCVAGEVRCKGLEVEECVRLTSGATEWRFTERCLGECSDGACVDGASCGCAAGSSAVACGAATRKAIQVNALLDTGAKVPCDDVSRVLVYTSPITSPDGTWVPDGTLVTFGISGAAGGLVSSDADPGSLGLQRPTLHGRASVVVKAPATCAGDVELTVNAAIAGRCDGSGKIKFAPFVQVAGGPVKVAYIADDFSTTTNADQVATTALWDTYRGSAVGLSGAQTGTGRDGKLEVTAFDTDIRAAGYARSWDVTAIGSQDVTLDAFPNLSPGDEVLVTTLWSNVGGAPVGNYEFKTVAAVATGKVVFTEPVQNIYVVGGAAVVPSSHRVVMQRVPHFTDVKVAQGASITAFGPSNTSGFATGSTGILAFRATGTVELGGELRALGNQVGLADVATGKSPLMQRMSIGNPGGIIFVQAATITFKVGAAFAADAIKVRAFAAGTVWLGAGKLEFGTTTNRVEAPNGFIRLDYGTLDNNEAKPPAPFVNPTNPAWTDLTRVFRGQSGAYLAQSKIAYTVAAAGPGQPTLEISSANLVGVFGGTDSSEIYQPDPLNGTTALNNTWTSVNVHFSANGGGNYANAGTGNVSFSSNQAPNKGKDFVFKAELSTLEAKSIYLRGIAVKVNLTP